MVDYRQARADYYLRKAEDCARSAERMKDPEARAAFVELAQQWRALAKQFSGPEGDHREE